MQKRKSVLEHKKFFTSLTHAFRGVNIAFREEQNIRIHVFCAVAVLFLMALIGTSGIQFIVVCISITLVIVMELVNSIIERFLDMVKPQVSHLVAKMKDMTAAAVLVCALNACIVGSVIFFPKLVELVRFILF